MNFTLNKNTDFSETKATYDSAMDAEITRIFTSEINTAQARPNLITDIHNYVAETLTYSKVGNQSTIRSVYTALCGSHVVVCEGYGKMFKVLCDACEIPCIIVTGVAGTDEKENHLWNYVEVDVDAAEYWFLIDCTWDDQQEYGGGIETNYLMAGTHTMGFNSTLVKDSHDPTGLNGLNITLPALSYYSHAEFAPQHTVTFMITDGLAYGVEYVGHGCSADVPADPTWTIGKHFYGWYIGDEEYNFSNAVNENLVITAHWSDVKVFTLRYDSNGGTDVQATREETSDSGDPAAPSKTMKVTNSVPFRDGFKFVEWNTAKDGTGLSYKSGDDIVLTTDEYTLYAIWEDTNSVNYKINSFVDKAAAFLGGETIPGVSNMLLTILVITAAVSLLAILAISRK